MKKQTILDRLRGKPLFKVGDHGTVFKQGSILCVALVVLVSYFLPDLKNHFGEGITLGLILFALLFASALVVRFELSDGSEI